MKPFFISNTVMERTEQHVGIFCIPDTTIARMIFRQDTNSRRYTHPVKLRICFIFSFILSLPVCINCGLHLSDRSNNSFCLRLISQTIRDTCSQHPSRRSIGNDEQLIHLMKFSFLYGSHRAALIT